MGVTLGHLVATHLSSPKKLKEEVREVQKVKL
jgi:hypothetical protein